MSSEAVAGSSKLTAALTLSATMSTSASLSRTRLARRVRNTARPNAPVTMSNAQTVGARPSVKALRAIGWSLKRIVSPASGDPDVPAATNFNCRPGIPGPFRVMGLQQVLPDYGEHEVFAGGDGEMQICRLVGRDRCR